MRRICLVGFLLLAACSPVVSPPEPVVESAPEYLGSENCNSCHRNEYALWRDSQHAQAMQHATPATVLGDFSGVEFRHFYTTTDFFTRGTEYVVRTDNEYGELQEFPVAYTFGVNPLQQYLIEFPDGRLQALPVAWDTRPSEVGGQRWFHIYPDEPIESTDALHWTGREQNWNFMCAECHSTNLVKNYDVANDSYATTFSEISVGCEACHGAASRHVAQAVSNDFDSRMGLLVDLDDSGRAVWEMNGATGIAARSEVRMRPPKQPEACGRCHSRRAPVSPEYVFGHALLDTHAPVLLDDGLYFPDGQVRDEVYVYGSFIQSRMYQAGVSCGNCHNAHSGKLRTGPEPDATCATCHLQERFATSEHHFHDANLVACVDCHMPSRNYMVVDGRRDHSFRVPRPDLTLGTDSPNACNRCHADKDANWAQNSLREWYGDNDSDHYGYALHAARTRAAGANELLAKVIANSSNPGVAVGSALSELRPPLSQVIASTIQASLANGDPLVRIGALRALAGVQLNLQVEWGGALLSDALLAVRIEAARLVSPLRSILPARFESAFVRAEQAMVLSLVASAERPEAIAGLASIYVDAGDTQKGEAEFLKALRLAPLFTIARINLADLYRRTDRDSDAETLLREGLLLTPEAAALHHSLGLLLARRDRHDQGLVALRQAMDLDTANSRYAYVYAVALNSLGQSEAATKLLLSVKDRFAADFDIHWALATMLRDQGSVAAAKKAAAELATRFPGLQQVDALLESLQ